MQAETRVQDSRPRHQRLETAPHWHVGKHKTSSTKLLISGENGYMHARKLKDI